jgi:hypothetical protein
VLEQLKQFVNDTPKGLVTQRLGMEPNRDLLLWLNTKTSHLPSEVTVRERIFHALNPDTELLCDKGNRRKFKTLDSGYGFCGPAGKCACHSEKLKTVSGHSPSIMANIVERRKITWLEKYGVDNPLKLPENIEAKKRALVSPESKVVFERMRHDKLQVGLQQVVTRVQNHVTPLFGVESYVGCFRKNQYDWSCNSCEYEFKYHVDYGTTPKCPKCFPHNISKGHREIMDFLDSLGVDYEVNTKRVIAPKELDIYIESMNLAIEFNGEYFHSDVCKPKTYHAQKWVDCNEQGIRLIQIFGDEFKNKPDLIKARLKNVLGFSKRVFARKCQVVELCSSVYRSFLNEHHIQGAAASAIKLGLMYDTHLVAVMGFGRPRYANNEIDYELIRYCSDGTVVGGASKLFSHFVNTYSPSSVMSYADRQWSVGGLYSQLGFSDVTENPLNVGYFYVKNSIRFNRQSLTKQKLVAMGYDEKLSETEILKKEGYLRYFNAGNLTFVWTRK